MLTQFVSNYALTKSIIESSFKPNGDSASPKEVVVPE